MFAAENVASVLTKGAVKRFEELKDLLGVASRAPLCKSNKVRKKNRSILELFRNRSRALFGGAHEGLDLGFMSAPSLRLLFVFLVDLVPDLGRKQRRHNWEHGSRRMLVISLL